MHGGDRTKQSDISLPNDDTTDQVTELLNSSDLADALETEHFRHFLDHIPFAVAVSKVGKDRERIAYVNPAFAKLLGQEPAKLIGCDWSATDAFCKEDDPQIRLGRIISAEEDFLGTFCLDLPSQRRIVDAYASPIEIRKEAQKFRLAALIDVTERDRSQRADYQDRIRDKDLLLKELQHRVKNSLQIITALIRFEGRNVRYGKAVDFDRIAARIEALSLLYEALAHGAGPDEIDLGDYLNHMASAAMRSYAPERIRLQMKTERCSVPIDVAMPVGLLVNEAMTNAFKYAFADRPTGTITVECLRKGDDYAILIADDGNGFAHDAIWPAPGKISALIVQSVKETAQASVKVESAPGFGTKISVQMPATPGKMLNARKYLKTVLVVDDDPDVLQMIVDHLRGFYRVLMAKDGAEALSILGAEGSVDLILTDIVMPGSIDGFEVGRRATSLQPNVRVLYMSGFFKSIPAAENGVIYDRLLKKPFRLDELESEIKNAFSTPGAIEAQTQ